MLPPSTKGYGREPTPVRYTKQAKEITSFILRVSSYGVPSGHGIHHRSSTLFCPFHHLGIKIMLKASLDQSTRFQQIPKIRKFTLCTSSKMQQSVHVKSAPYHHQHRPKKHKLPPLPRMPATPKHHPNPQGRRRRRFANLCLITLAFLPHVVLYGLPFFLPSPWQRESKAPPKQPTPAPQHRLVIAVVVQGNRVRRDVVIQRGSVTYSNNMILGNLTMEVEKWQSVGGWSFHGLWVPKRLIFLITRFLSSRSGLLLSHCHLTFSRRDLAPQGRFHRTKRASRRCYSRY